MFTPNQKEIKESKTSISFQNSSSTIRWLHTKDKANFLLAHSFKENTKNLIDTCIRKADAGLHFK